MTLNEILLHPQDTLLYMERLVNNGSPSNFSFQYMTSKETCPLYTEAYSLYTVKNISSEEIEDFGFIPKEICNLKYKFLLHPDWKNVTTAFDIEETSLVVTPTSSSRTVKLLEFDYYIKLFYPGILGRITRELRREHILSSIDVSNILNDLLQKNSLPNTFAYFPERGGRLYHSQNGDIGFLIRDAVPCGNGVHEIQALIPAFSLFSSDRKNKDLPLIVQILKKKYDPQNYLLEQLIFPIVDIFFGCIFYGGLLFEMHSQNFLIGINSEYDIVSIVLRDLESVDKDITIMQHNNIQYAIKSKPYKCISDNQYNYFIKHSFMYDHKLGEYFFDQLLFCVEEYTFVEKYKIEAEIRHYIKTRYRSEISSFFPEGKWYKFKNVLVDRNQEERPYISFPYPRYR